MHIVVYDVFCLHRTESAKAYMKKDGCKLHAHFFKFFHKFGGEVKPCRGGCCTAVNFAVHRLISLLVFKSFVDIGRERHIAYSVQNVLKNSVKLERYCADAIFTYVFNCGRKFVTDFDDTALSCLASGAHYAFPMGVVKTFQKQNFKGGLLAVNVSKYAGRDNSRVVDDKKVTLLQMFCYIVKMLVGDSVTFSVVHEHTTAVPRLCRCLGDKLLRKVIVKVTSFQVCHCFLGYCPFPYICGALSVSAVINVSVSSVCMRPTCKLCLWGCVG